MAYPLQQVCHFTAYTNFKLKVYKNQAKYYIDKPYKNLCLHIYLGPVLYELINQDIQVQVHRQGPFLHKSQHNGWKMYSSISA